MVQMGAYYDAQFQVANEGTSEFTIVDIEVGGPTIYDEWFDEYTPVFPLFVYGPELDMWTGQPTGNKIWQMYERGYQTFAVGNEPCSSPCPCSTWHTNSGALGTYDVPVTFRYAGSQEDIESGKLTEKTVNVKFIVTRLPP